MPKHAGEQWGIPECLWQPPSYVVLGRMVGWDVFRADLQQGPIPGTRLFCRKEEQLAFFPRMGGNCLLSDLPGCRDSRDSFPAHTGLILRQDLSRTHRLHHWYHCKKWGSPMLDSARLPPAWPSFNFPQIIKL